ncbi:MAG: 3-oxoadipate enol-lactonase [Verrucomicrobiales bacterium]
MPLTAKHDGVEIYFRTEGTGPPLLLISGTGHDHQFWSGQLPTFREQFRTLVFDNRGVGKSSVPEPGYSLADMAGDAVRVLDSASVDKAHVMGFSMGGHIAQELAINYPDRVSSLGVHHSWCRNSARLRTFQETRLELARQDQRLALAEFSMLGLHSHDYYNAHADEMRAHRDFLLDQSPMNVGWIGQLEACLTGDTCDRLDRIDVPTLVTCSTLDVIAAPHHSRAIADQIPGATLVEIPDTGHVALMERPQQFADLCLGFLRPHVDRPRSRD